MIVQKALTPGSPGVMKVAEKNGVHYDTLRRWLKSYGNPIYMDDTKARPENWSPEQKLNTIIKTASMKENELGEFLRRNGLHSSTLEEWKQAFLLGVRSVGRPQKDPEIYNLRKKEQELERELRRKDKALAEMAARVILLKKSQEIFGGTEDDE